MPTSPRALETEIDEASLNRMMARASSASTRSDSALTEMWRTSSPPSPRTDPTTSRTSGPVIEARSSTVAQSE